MKSNPVLKNLARKTVNDVWIGSYQEYIHRLYYVNAGSAHIRFGNHEYTLNAGKFYLFAPSSTYDRLSADNFDYTHFSFYTTPALQSDKFIEIPSNLSEIEKLIDVVNSTLDNGFVTRENGAWFLKIFLSIIEQHLTLPFIEDDNIIKALDIINKKPYNVTVKTLAKELHLSESYFIHLFTSTMNCSPMKYIRKVRLTDAEGLLKAGTPVSEVAEKCGYSSSTALWKAIRKNYGCTPTELKKK